MNDIVPYTRRGWSDRAVSYETGAKLQSDSREFMRYIIVALHVKHSLASRSLWACASCGRLHLRANNEEERRKRRTRAFGERSAKNSRGEMFRNRARAAPSKDGMASLIYVPFVERNIAKALAEGINHTTSATTLRVSSLCYCWAAVIRLACRSPLRSAKVAKSG